MPKRKFIYYLFPLGTDYTEEEESKSVKSGYVSSDSST